MNKFKRITAIFIIFTLLFACPVFAEEEQKQQQQEQQENPNTIYLQNIVKFIKANYKFEVDDAQLLESALIKIIEENPAMLEKAVEGMFDSLDQHTTYFNEEQYDQFATQVDGQFGGIGIRVMNKDGYVTVVAPLENTPGERAGLKSGDKIVSVNELDITGYDINMAVPFMRGEQGTSVKLGIKRDGVEGILYFTIVRDIIKLNPITNRILEEQVGYIKISDFNANTDEYLAAVLKNFDEENITKIIIDVRNNPGGSLSEVVRVARHFVPEGPIVHIEYKDETKRKTEFSYLKDLKYEVAVLINEGSASASEILAGAIQDTDAGTIIGTKSFGKGTVQQLLPLKIGGAIKITIARYLTPNEISIDGDGIHPDITVENMKEKIDTSILETLESTRKPTIGDAGSDVLAAEQRLQLLGYDVGEPDETFDEKTLQAVKLFQAEQELYAYGVLDFTTQRKLDETVKELEVIIDKQLEKAVETLIR